MKTLVQHRRAATVLLLSIVLLGAMSMFLIQRLKTLNEGGSWVEHSERVRFELAEVLQSMTDLGAGLNAYLVGHDPDVFAPARRADAALPAQLKSLEEIVRDSDIERPLFDALVLLANRRRVETGELRERARAGDADAVTRALTDGQARSIMIATRSIVAQLAAEEERALAGHRRAVVEAYRDAIATVDATAVVAAILLIAVTVVTLREGERVRMIQDELATTLRSIGDAVISTDALGRVRFMNDVAQRLTGHGDRASRGRPLAEVFQIINESTRGTVESPVARVLREGSVVNLANHTLLIARDGSERPIEDSGAPIRDAAGQLAGVVLVFRDATFERRARAELQQSDARFKAAVAAIDGVLWTNTPEGEMRGEQLAWAALTGQSHDDYQGFGWSKAVHPEDAQPSIDAWLAAVRAQRTFVFEHRVRRHDGEWRMFSVRAIPLLDAEGAIREWVGVHADITDQKRAEQELRARERQFVTFADAMPQLAWTERADGSHAYFNRGWYDYTGSSVAASLRRDGWTTVIHPDDLQRGALTWAAVREAGKPYEIELRLRRHDGVYRWFLVRAVPDLDSAGSILQWVGTCTDIDHAKQTQVALRETEAALRSADARKDDFLATLSHELRNPLAPIRTAARLLTSATVTPAERSRSIAVISRQVGHMAALIDDLMDVARITRGVLILKPAITELRTIIETAIESVRPALEEKHHRLVTDCPDIPVALNVDPVRLTQVITNLLTNAVKYTNADGLITIGAKMHEQELAVYVRDTGIGISGAMAAQVFEMFAQVQPATERSAGGLGIGLGLAKALVELHGGRLQVFSAGPGQGSEFTVLLPSTLVSAGIDTPQQTYVPAAAGSHSTVLIADDNRDAAEILGMLLETSGHSVTVAYNGLEAVQKAKALHPKILVLDIGMPGLNGYEVARQIRQETWGDEAVLIAVTGWGQEDDKRKAAAAGFDHHLTKPVDPDVLERLIAAS